MSTSLLRQCGGSGSQACAYYFSHLDAELERVAAVKAGWLTEAFSSSDSQPDLSQDVITKLISESYDPQNHITDVADFYDGWSDEEDESGAPADKAPESSTATHGAAETAVSDVQSSKPSTDAYNAGHITNVAEFYEGWSSDEGDAADDKDDGNNSTPQPASEEFPVLNDDTAGVSQGRKSPAHSQLHEFLASPSLGLEHLYDVFISGGVTSVEDFADIEGGVSILLRSANTCGACFDGPCPIIQYVYVSLTRRLKSSLTTLASPSKRPAAFCTMRQRRVLQHRCRQRPLRRRQRARTPGATRSRSRPMTKAWMLSSVSNPL